MTDVVRFLTLASLPGAQGVHGALDASDDIRSREAQRDSVLGGQQR
ncbi:MAG: hypothetical protein ACOC8K_07235 [Gemmatimonadota bacterium]